MSSCCANTSGLGCPPGLGNCDGVGFSSYNADRLPRTLYDCSVEERNRTFGYDKVVTPRVQAAWHAAYFGNPYPDAVSNVLGTCCAPKDYYFDTRVDPSRKAVIGQVAERPHLYNDNVLPAMPTFATPNLYRSGAWFSRTSTPFMQNCTVQWIPHAQPVEVAPRTQQPRFWTGDLNAYIYERSLVGGATEQPYSNFDNRRALLNLVAENLRNNKDPYTKRLDSPDGTFACQVQKNGGRPPAVTNF